MAVGAQDFRLLWPAWQTCDVPGTCNPTHQYHTPTPWRPVHNLNLALRDQIAAPRCPVRVDWNLFFFFTEIILRFQAQRTRRYRINALVPWTIFPGKFTEDHIAWRKKDIMCCRVFFGADPTTTPLMPLRSGSSWPHTAGAREQLETGS